MTNARYRVVQTDARTGGIVTDLPVTAVSYGETLNAAGSASVTIPLRAPEADPATLYPGASGLAVLRDGKPVWGGLLWTAAADLAAGTLTLNASGYHSYYSGRVMRNWVLTPDSWRIGYFTGYKRTADQILLLRDWIENANTTGGIETDTGQLNTRGVVRSRSWTVYELKNVAEAVQELADDAEGFIFRYVPYWTPDGRVGNRILVRSVGDNPDRFILEHASTCNVNQVSYDAAALATQAFAVGADNGNGIKLVGIAENTDLADRVPVKQVVQTYSDVKSTEALVSKAKAIRDAGREPVAIPSLTLYPGAAPTDYVPGDVGNVRADYGYVQLLSSFVVTEVKTDVDANGTESVALSLANEELFRSAD